MVNVKFAAHLWHVLETLDYNPWEVGGRVSWNEVAVTYNRAELEDELTPNACRKRYQRIVEQLENNDYTVADYREFVMKSGELAWPVYPYVETEDEGGYEEYESESKILAMEMLGVGSEEDLYRMYGMDPSRWMLKDVRYSTWGYPGNMQVSVKPNFQPKELTGPELWAQIVELVNEVEVPPYTLDYGLNDGQGKDRLGVINIPDLHLENLGLNGETHKDAASVFTRVLRELVKSSGPVEKYLLVLGNDFGHFDNDNQTTSNGTLQEATTTLFRGFKIRQQLAIWAIEMLSELAPVDVVMCPGNHDRLTTFFLGEVLAQRYREDLAIEVLNIDNPVVIDNVGPGDEENLRRYYLWNQIGIMMVHGNEEKRADLPMIFATEGSHVFAPAKHRVIMTGHLHSEQVVEKFGVRTITLPSLSVTNAWHKRKGYVGNERKAVCYVFGPDRLIGEFYSYA